MARKKRDGRFINYYIDRTIYERLEHYAEDKAQPMTTALERILDEHLSRYEADAALMVRYCPSCHLAVRGTRCPVCDRKWLEEVKADDYCFLTEKDALWAGVLEDCLRQNGIPCLTQNSLGAGLTSKIGSMLERTTFFVKYGYYDRAKLLEEELFSGTAEAQGADANDPAE